MDNIWVLAQTPGGESSSGITSAPVSEQEGEAITATPDRDVSPPVTTQRRGFDTQSLFIIGLFFVVMYFFLLRGPRKKQQQHKQMVQSLKKNDRVRTIGGIIGTVVNIKDDEVTLKVDESNNTKLTIASSAIGKNLSQDKG